MISKKGQLYIITIAIIITVLVGLTAVSNYVRTKPRDTKIYDLGKEFNIETGNVIDYGIYLDKDLN